MGVSIPCRWILVGLGHAGFFIIYALRVNLSVALVAMVNNTYAQPESGHDPECGGRGNKTVEYNGGTFNWDQVQQGYILSSFFYGYLCTNLLGGYLASKYGGKWVFGIGVLVTAVLTLLTPLASKWSIYALIIVRVLEGLGEIVMLQTELTLYLLKQGVTFPSMHAMIAEWAPPKDRSVFVVLAYSGMQTGTVISLPVSGLLCSSSFLGGWPSVFYVFGAIGIIWFIIWSLCISSSPTSHPRISYEERSYIVNAIKAYSGRKKKMVLKVPWMSIFLSLPVWGIVVAHFACNWVWYMVLTGLPSYFQQVLDFDMQKNGFVSALPFLVAAIFTILSGYLADYIRSRFLSTVATRKLFTALGFFPCAGFLVLASYAGCDEIVLSVLYMALATGFLAFISAGYGSNHIDIAPRFSGVLMGLSNTFGTVAGCLTPTVTGYFTEHHPTRRQYRKVFFLAAGFACLGGLFFAIAGSGKEQTWSLATHQEEDIDDRKKLIAGFSSTNDNDEANVSDDDMLTA